MAVLHKPRFSSGVHRSNNEMRPFIDALVAARAELVLAGHDHHYERFAPQTGAGVASSAGVTQLVVGTGGRSLYPTAAIAPNSLVRSSAGFGWLRLTLRPGSADLRFVPIAPNTFTDQHSSSAVNRLARPAPGQTTQWCVYDVSAAVRSSNRDIVVGRDAMTIRDEDVATIAGGGGEVRTASGDKIGKVGQVYLDDDSGHPSWVTVKTACSGLKNRSCRSARRMSTGRTSLSPMTRRRSRAHRAWKPAAASPPKRRSASSRTTSTRRPSTQTAAATTSIPTTIVRAIWTQIGIRMSAARPWSVIVTAMAMI